MNDFNQGQMHALAFSLLLPAMLAQSMANRVYGAACKTSPRGHEVASIREAADALTEAAAMLNAAAALAKPMLQAAE